MFGLLSLRSPCASYILATKASVPLSILPPFLSLLKNVYSRAINLLSSSAGGSRYIYVKNPAFQPHPFISYSCSDFMGQTSLLLLDTQKRGFQLFGTYYRGSRPFACMTVVKFPAPLRFPNISLGFSGVKQPRISVPDLAGHYAPAQRTYQQSQCTELPSIERADQNYKFSVALLQPRYTEPSKSIFSSYICNPLDGSIVGLRGNLSPADCFYWIIRQESVLIPRTVGVHRRY